MKTKTNCIVFEFDGNCTECDTDLGTPIPVTINEILEVGIPACPDCGEEFELENECEVLE